jgi:hypothetical protein
MSFPDNFLLYDAGEMRFKLKSKEDSWHEHVPHGKKNNYLLMGALSALIPEVFY